MSRTFEIKLKGNPDEVMAKARKEAVSHGIHFSGDSQTGRFKSLGFEGSYLILEDILAVRITKKPLIVPWALIETSLRGFFS